MAFYDCRVVLVGTLYPGNLGATARVMHNFGLSDLALVAPVADRRDRRARRMSTHGEKILDGAGTFQDLGQALEGCVLVAGTTARKGGLFRKQTLVPPEAITPRLAAELGADRPVALVFGAETNGLSIGDVTRCHHLIQIPANEEYPALNLAQAVAICLYELHKAWLAQEAADLDEEEPATFESQERLFGQLQGALERIHFLYGDKADSLMHAIRHLLGKARLSEMEVKLLLGLARQIRWYVERNPGQS
jgi:tRNA/rRNA methyltransferase